MLRQAAKFYLWFSGWKVKGQPIPQQKSVLVVAYHTSNWDAFPAIAVNLAFNARVSWVGKESIFWWPLGAFLRKVGGIPILRNSGSDFVSQMVAEFKARTYFVLAMAPEGTRKKTHTWKTGFYYIARAAAVPVQVAAFDYQTKSFVFSPLYHLTGNLQQDVNQIREFLRPFVPRNPDLADFDFAVG